MTKKECSVGKANSTQRAQCSTAPEHFSVEEARSTRRVSTTQCLTHAAKAEARGQKVNLILTKDK
jgi:hypothetical protein